MKRRGILQGLVALAGIGCFTLAELREARAQSRETKKPLLTQRNLNTLLAKVHGSDRAASKASRDLLGFLQDHFTLTKRQAALVRELAGATTRAKRSRTQLARAIDAMHKGDQPLTVAIRQQTDRKHLALTMVRPSADGPARLDAVAHCP